MTGRIKRYLLVSGGFLILMASLLFIERGILRQSSFDKDIPAGIVVYTWTGDHYFREAACQFEQKSGIPVRVVVNNSSVYMRKAQKESSLPEGTIDCMLINGSWQKTQLIEARVLSVSGSFEPLYQSSCGFLYDSDITTDPPLTWKEFNRWIDENPGQFGFTPVGGEAGFSFIYSVLRHFDAAGSGDAWGWFRVRRESMLYTSSDYDTLRLLSSGKLALASVRHDQMLFAVKSGELPPSVKMYVPRFGALADQYGLAVPSNSSHTYQTGLFIDFLKTPAQRERLKEALNADAPAAPVSGYFLNQPGPGIRMDMIESFKDRVLYF